jgi:hypothetical protein
MVHTMVHVKGGCEPLGFSRRPVFSTSRDSAVCRCADTGQPGDPRSGNPASDIPRHRCPITDPSRDSRVGQRNHYGLTVEVFNGCVDGLFEPAVMSAKA